MARGRICNSINDIFCLLGEGKGCGGDGAVFGGDDNGMEFWKTRNLNLGPKIAYEQSTVAILSLRLWPVVILNDSIQKITKYKK